MYIRRTRFDDFDDWIHSESYDKFKDTYISPIIKLMRGYVKVVDAVNGFVGGVAMYLLLVMMGVLIYAVVSNALKFHVVWAVEMAQFTMAAYYLLGGGASLKRGIHVRMDFLYEKWSLKKKAMIDIFTIFFLMFYCWALVRGGWESCEYALEFGQKSRSIWRPYLAPIKIIMTTGMALMLLQATAELIKDCFRAFSKEV